MAVNKVVYNRDGIEETLIDLTSDTVTADKLAKGYTAHTQAGELVTGTMESGGRAPEITDTTGVAFFDYDGEVLEVWNKSEIASKTELPTPTVTHDGLIFDGWNWTLEQIQSFGTEQLIVVGAHYLTTSGLTEYVIRVNSELGMTVRGSTYYTMTIDYGDGTVQELTNQNYNHTYTQEGMYTITVNEDYIVPAGWEQNIIEIHYSQYSTTGYGYGVQGYCNLKKISIPSRMTSSSSNHTSSSIAIGFTKLKFITISASTDSWKTYIGGQYKVEGYPSPCAFSTNLFAISLPASCYLYNNAFYQCNNLKYITISKFGDNYISPFAYTSIQKMAIPSGTTSISTSFARQSAISELKIPSSVKSVDSRAFYYCSPKKTVIDGTADMVIYDGAFSYASPPSSAYYCFDFSNSTGIPTLKESSGPLPTPSNIKAIYVPSALYDDWIAATNWTNYADKIVAV